LHAWCGLLQARRRQTQEATGDERQAGEREDGDQHEE